MGPFGYQEMLVIMVVALVVFGPHRLPELARYIAKFTKMFKDAARELQSQLEMSEWELQKSIDKKKKKKELPDNSSDSPEENDNIDDPYLQTDDESNNYYDDPYHYGDYEDYGYPEKWDGSEDSDQENKESQEEKSTDDSEDEELVNEDPAKEDDAKRYSRELEE